MSTELFTWWVLADGISAGAVVGGRTYAICPTTLAVSTAVESSLSYCQQLLRILCSGVDVSGRTEVWCLWRQWLWPWCISMMNAGLGGGVDTVGGRTDSTCARRLWLCGACLTANMLAPSSVRGRRPSVHGVGYAVGLG